MLEQNVGLRKDIIPTVPNSAKAIKPGSKANFFRRMPVGPPRQNVAFTGRGFLPDLMSEHAFTMFPEASRTLLENEGVYGLEGMMPPSGTIGFVQPGQKLDGGAGGAGSFATSFTGRANR